MSDLSLTILPETADDAAGIERLHARTFGPGRYAKTAYRIREGGAHRLDLSFTARIGTLQCAAQFGWGRRGVGGPTGNHDQVCTVDGVHVAVTGQPQ